MPAKADEDVTEEDASMDNPAEDFPRTDHDPVRASTYPREDQVARRAYELYESRGSETGADIDDWLQAERELTGERNPDRRAETK
jgi:hypothetical protein